MTALETRAVNAATRRRALHGKRYGRDENRDAQMIVMRESGMITEDIGAAFGVTRERARQILKRNGYTGTVCGGLDPLAVMRALRSTPSRRIGDVAEMAGATVAQVRHFLSEIGRERSATRLLRWRRRSAAKAFIVAQLRAFVAKHGRVPYSSEFGFTTGQPRHPDITVGASIQRYFGSFPAAFEAAGLSRRGRGARGHRETSTRRPAKTHCIHGHEFTPENTYTFARRAGGVPTRHCKTCHLARKRAAYRRQKQEAA